MPSSASRIVPLSPATPARIRSSGPQVRGVVDRREQVGGDVQDRGHTTSLRTRRTDSATGATRTKPDDQRRNRAPADEKHEQNGCRDDDERDLYALSADAAQQHPPDDRDRPHRQARPQRREGRTPRERHEPAEGESRQEGPCRHQQAAQNGFVVARAPDGREDQHEHGVDCEREQNACPRDTGGRDAEGSSHSVQA